MENQQPTGEAQNGQKKAWYKSGWGLVIAILFFPYFLLWFMWAKTNWGKALKITITVAFAFFNLVAIMSDDPNKNTNQQAEQKAPVAETKSEAPVVQQAVFDVPSLIGKSIDEVKQILGAPTTYKEPTKQQLALMDIWDMEYTKDDINLLVTYNPKSKVVLDYFIDGSDKIKLLALGNLQEKNDAYIAEFVKSVSNANEITGVKISKKLPQELNGNVTFNAVAFKIENKEDYNWANCKFSINSKFDFKSANGIKANDSLIIPFSEFTNDGERFNFFSNKPESLFIACDTLGQHRTNYFAIK